jgi:hypothetical protein
VGNASDLEPVHALRELVETRNERAQATSFRIRLRRWVGRVSGRSDRYLLLTVARATDALASQCDAIGNRITQQEAITRDITGAFGEELALLRAEVQHLQRICASQENPTRSGP